MPRKTVSMEEAFQELDAILKSWKEKIFRWKILLPYIRKVWNW